MMEGINWEEVTAQANSIETNLGNLRDSIFSYFQDFAEELSYYWSSGNAETFGEKLKSNVESFRTYTQNVQSEIKSMINHAAEIYSNRFNVQNGIGNIDTWDHNVVPYMTFDNPFRGASISIFGFITGMNKTAVDECCNFYKDKIKTSADDIKSKIESIHLSIFDTANVQKDAFDQRIKEAISYINMLLDDTLEEIYKAKEEEKDNLNLAKQQTVNTFNA